MMRNYFVFVLFITVMSCGKMTRVNTDELDVNCTFFDLDNCAIENTSNNQFASMKIIKLDNNEKCLLSGVDKMIVTHKGIYVLDTKYKHVLYLFAHNGQFMKAIGKQGHGKGEYVRINNFSANEEGDTVAILDDFGKNIKIYNADGHFLKCYNVEGEFGWDDILLLNNNYYLFNYHHESKDILSVFTSDFVNRDVWGQFESELIPGVGSSYKYLQYSPKYISVLDYYNACFYLFNRERNGEIKKIVLNSSDIISMKNAEDESKYDAIIDYILADEFIYVTVARKQQIYNYKIDINNNIMTMLRTSNYASLADGYYDGKFYISYSPKRIKDAIKYNSCDTLFINATESLRDSVTYDDNFFILVANEKTDNTSIR